MSRMRGDEGRFPIGAIFTLAALGAAGYGAYWALGEFGFLGETSAQASPSPTESVTVVADDRPQWLQDTEYDLPPVVATDDEREPESYRLEPWVWDLVDDSWDLWVLREGEGDNYTWLSDLQILYLVGPEEELFEISPLRTDFDMDVVHWDPELEVAWLKRGGKSSMEQVIEYDLRTLESETAFAGGAVASANVVEGGVANLAYVGDQSDGSELWITYDFTGATTGVLWREGDQWQESLIQDQIRRMVLQGFSRELGVDAWLDPATGRGVYHGVYIDPDTRTVADEQWVVHDLLTDAFDDDIVVATPSDDCVPVGERHAGVFDGDRIVATCGGTEWLLDPYGLSEPVQR